MKIEVMIYIYGAVCGAMIAFNLVYNALLKSREPRMEKRCKKIKKQMAAELIRVQQGRTVSEKHLTYLRRSLYRVNNLIAFGRVLDELFEKQPELEQAYVNQIQSVFLYLAIAYRKKDEMQSGYFTYFLSRYTAERHLPMDSLQDVLLDYVKKKNLYCRYNALKALYHFASAEHIALAIKAQDDGKIFVHEKLITEGLLSFHGDHRELIEELWKLFPAFSVHTRLSVLNYIRFQSGDYKEKLFKIMKDEQEDKELRLSAIRYFGKYRWERALEPLLTFASDQDQTRWEYANVAVTSLAGYEGERVIAVLKEALHSGNWYVRYSAAQSLDAHHVAYKDLIDIVAGKDRYAREMMAYRLESRKLQEQGV